MAGCERQEAQEALLGAIKGDQEPLDSLLQCLVKGCRPVRTCSCEVERRRHDGWQTSQPLIGFCPATAQVTVFHQCSCKVCMLQYRSAIITDAAISIKM